MDMKALKWQFLHGHLVKRLIVKSFFVITVMVVVSFFQMAHVIRNSEPMMLSFGSCPLNFGSNPTVNFTGFFKPVSGLAFPFFGASFVKCGDENLTKTVFKELMERNFLDLKSKALCVGKKSLSAALALEELGLSNAIGVDRHPYYSLIWRRFVYELDYEDNSFDFVFSSDLDKVSVPALLVLEIERVLRPGGTGAMLVGASSVYGGNFIKGNLIRSATPVSSFLKSSDVVHVCGVGTFTLVMFKKKPEIVESLERSVLPDYCPSTMNSKPFLKYLEPLVEEKPGQFETGISYLPKFVNITSRNKLVYINVGAGQYVETTLARMIKPHYPIPHHLFNVYVVDHNTSALSLYVKNPGINFVYHPGLAGEEASPADDSDEYPSAPFDHEGFDFVPWFRETVKDGGYVVLMMNARATELNILAELFKSGSICHVDELFLRCSAEDCSTTLCGDCTSLFKTLRKSGVFAHQWWGD